MKQRMCAAAMLSVFFANGLLQAQTNAGPQLLPPHGELAPTFWELHGWQVVAGAFVFLFLLVLIVGWLRRPKQVEPEAPGAIARRALDRLRGGPEDGVLIVEVSRVLRNYVIAAFGFRSEELTTSEFREALQSNPRVPKELAIATADFLRRCDEWKFAPTHPSTQLDAVSTAFELVNKLELSREPVPAATR